MATVTICSDFGAPKNQVCHCFHCLPSISPEVMGPDDYQGYCNFTPTALCETITTGPLLNCYSLKTWLLLKRKKRKKNNSLDFFFLKLLPVLVINRCIKTTYSHKHQSNWHFLLKQTNFLCSIDRATGNIILLKCLKCWINNNVTTKGKHLFLR